MARGGYTRLLWRPSWPAAIASATEFRSWTVTGQTTSHARQYASMILAFRSNLRSSPRVYESCSCCLPQMGHAERKLTYLSTGADPSLGT
jgi:hypothetical protein